MEYFKVEIDKKQLRALTFKLKNAEKDTPKHLRNAINRTVTEAMRQIRAGRAQGYTIKAGRFTQGIRVQRATASHLDATIKSSGRPPTIKNFKTTTPKSGAKADITKTGLKSLRKGEAGAAFILRGGKAAGLIAQRKTRKRFPLRILYGNSVPKMVEKIWEGERGGQGDLTDEIRERLLKEISIEIAKIM